MTKKWQSDNGGNVCYLLPGAYAMQKSPLKDRWETTKKQSEVAVAIPPWVGSHNIIPH